MRNGRPGALDIRGAHARTALRIARAAIDSITTGGPITII